MHPRKEILKNQQEFRWEISEALKAEYKQTMKELRAIQPKDKLILEEKDKLQEKAKKIRISEQIEKFFITENNIYPNYYAYWDENKKQVLKLKYIDAIIL